MDAYEAVRQRCDYVDPTLPAVVVAPHKRITLQNGPVSTSDRLLYLDSQPLGAHSLPCLAVSNATHAIFQDTASVPLATVEQVATAGAHTCELALYGEKGRNCTYSSVESLTWGLNVN